MEAIIKMNNMGAECLRTEQYAQALGIFKGAVQGMRAVEIGESFDDCQDSQANRFYQFAASTVQEKGEQQEEQQEDLEQQTTSQSQDVTTLHFKSIPLPSSSACPVDNSASGTMVYRHVAIADSVGTSEDERSRFSAVLFYNMALVYQTHGLAQGQNDSLARALDLYNIAKDLLFSTVDDYEQDIDIYRLAMAILNNAGTILFELSNFDKAIACFQQVKVILKGCQRRTAAKCDPCNGFWLNTLVVLEAPAHSPAA